jgi:two-component system sensor histidine kinase KdpD
MKGLRRISGYPASIGLVLAASLTCQLIRPFINTTDMVMVYLLAVVLAAIALGLRPALFTALLGVLAFDFFFVPPRFSFSIADTQYLLTFIGLFVIGVLISSLVGKVRERSRTLQEREKETLSLYHLTRDLAVAADMPAIFRAARRNLEESLHAGVAMWAGSGRDLALVAAGVDLNLGDEETKIAQWSFQSRRAAGNGTEIFSGSSFTFFPLSALANTVGVLALLMESRSETLSPQLRRLLEVFAGQIAMAIERVHLVEQAEQAQILQAREGLERALLNSISHDLRTPLVSITGALGSLLEQGNTLGEDARRVLLATAWEEAGRLNRFVGNLLDMTRLEAGAVKLNRELNDVQDLVGCALAAIEPRAGVRKIQVQIPSGLPLIPMDLTLMTQVLVNVLDNALRYSSPEGQITLTVHDEGPMIRMEIADQGPGVPETDLQRIFDKFYRIPVPEGAGGTGLGLTICKGIVEAQGGTICAESRKSGGLRVVIRLPAVDQLCEGIDHAE